MGWRGRQVLKAVHLFSYKIHNPPYYKLDQGLVITNNYFTKQAQNQTKGTNVMLCDRDMLQQKLHEMYGNIENH
ncbi:restriction endonuclease [Bacillus toyonensis]|uniref:restriction endonuclease n=1 Tax=Bacillus toyonensis TaxID=155322 RepID=UPI003AFFAEED